MGVFTMLVLAHVTTTEFSFMNRMSIPMAVLIAWLFLRRAPGLWDGVGLAVLVGGLVWTAWGFPANIRTEVLTYLAISSLASALRNLMAELHPGTDALSGFRQRCQVTGRVLLPNAGLFLGITLALGALAEVHPSLAEFPLPRLDDLFNLPVLLIALVLGALLLPLEIYCLFHAAQWVTAETFGAVTALAPFVTLPVELLFQAAGLLDMTTLSRSDFATGLLISLGALIMILGRRRTLSPSLPSTQSPT
jgi:drug/metabolite transporter (DMT)-like permease